MKDLFSAVLLVFFLAVTLYGLFSLGKDNSSSLAGAATAIGMVGTLLSLVVAVVLVLGNE